MRSNMFGDKYCTDAEEVKIAMDEKDYDTGGCYADIEYDDDEDQWIAELKDNVTGDVVCYVEGFSSRNSLREMLVYDLDFPNSAVNYI